MTKTSIPVMEGKLRQLIRNMELYPLIYNAHIQKAERQEKHKLPLPELKAVVMATNKLNAFQDSHGKGCCYPAVAHAIQSNGTRTIRKLGHGTINPSHLTPTHHYPIKM
jgi:hypothetical protein